MGLLHINNQQNKGNIITKKNSNNLSIDDKLISYGLDVLFIVLLKYTIAICDGLTQTLQFLLVTHSSFAYCVYVYE